ncbi:hypothetical protein NQZ68_034070 [Dissostichus eleginoides]|nr:hypothetical protein NQZ68_034070 [Dissostichus eleginoides]
MSEFLDQHQNACWATRDVLRLKRLIAKDEPEPEETPPSSSSSSSSSSPSLLPLLAVLIHTSTLPPLWMVREERLQDGLHRGFLSDGSGLKRDKLRPEETLEDPAAQTPTCGCEKPGGAGRKPGSHWRSSII